MARPTRIADWASKDTANKLAPNAEQIVNGFNLSELPRGNHLNYILNALWNWTNYIKSDSHQEIIYISQLGDDLFSGSIIEPVRTLSRAFELANLKVSIESDKVNTRAIIFCMESVSFNLGASSLPRGVDIYAPFATIVGNFDDDIDGNSYKLKSIMGNILISPNLKIEAQEHTGSIELKRENLGSVVLELDKTSATEISRESGSADVEGRLYLNLKEASIDSLTDFDPMEYYGFLNGKPLETDGSEFSSGGVSGTVNIVRYSMAGHQELNSTTYFNFTNSTGDGAVTKTRVSGTTDPFTYNSTRREFTFNSIVRLNITGQIDSAGSPDRMIFEVNGVNYERGYAIDADAHDGASLSWIFQSGETFRARGNGDNLNYFNVLLTIEEIQNTG